MNVAALETRETLEVKTAQAARTVWKRYEEFLADPDDPETAHRLRVSIRTLRSLVGFLEPWLAERWARDVQDDLKRVVKRTSRLRELDVLCELVAERDDLPEGTLERCQCAAAEERAAVLSDLQTKRYVKRLERSVYALCDMRWNKQARAKGIAKKKVQRRFEKMATTLQGDLETLDVSDYERVHAARKRVKQVRYVAERYADVLTEEFQVIAKDMKAEQDRLGAICDAKVNAELLAGLL